MTDQITVSRALLRQAIDALSDTQTDGESPQWDIEKAAYDALRTALEQPAVEPVAWFVASTGLFSLGPERPFDDDVWQPVFAAPQAQQQKLDRLEHVHKATADLLLDSDTLLKQALGELERAEQIMLRECGIGVINVNTIAAIKTHLGQA